MHKFIKEKSHVNKSKNKKCCWRHFRQGLGRFCWYRLARKSECNPLCTSKLHTIWWWWKLPGWSNWALFENQEDYRRNQSSLWRHSFPYGHRPCYFNRWYPSWLHRSRKWIDLWYPKRWVVQIELHASWWYPYGWDNLDRKWIHSRSSSPRNLYQTRDNSKRRYLPCLYFKHPSRSSLPPRFWSSRCLFTWPYHRYVRSSCPLWSWLPDGRKSERLECHRWNRWRNHPSSWRNQPAIPSPATSGTLGWPLWGWCSPSSLEHQRSYPMGQHRLHGSLPCHQRCCDLPWSCANRLGHLCRTWLGSRYLHWVRNPRVCWWLRIETSYC